MRVGDGTPGPGRPKGALNKKTREIIEWSERFFESPKWLKSAEKRMIAGKAPHLETYLLQRAHGKPKEVVEHQIPDGPMFVIGSRPSMGQE